MPSGEAHLDADAGRTSGDRKAQARGTCLVPGQPPEEGFSAATSGSDPRNAIDVLDGDK